MWWICIGIVCGAIAVANILGHHLTKSQDEILILMGIAHWVLGGFVCWLFEGVKTEPGPSAASEKLQVLKHAEHTGH